MLGLVVAVAMSGCEKDTLLDFAIGDISGLWAAESYEFVSNADVNTRVDLISRDGASLLLTVDSRVSPPTVGSSFNNGRGTTTSGGGDVDLRNGTLQIGDDRYTIDQDGNSMTLTNPTTTFDFGSGPVSATLVILLNRV
jgi:hypothetical protein